MKVTLSWRDAARRPLPPNLLETAHHPIALPDGLIPGSPGPTVRHTAFSDGDLFPGDGIFPHMGDEIAKKGVEIGCPGAFSRRRKKGLNRPNWTADLILIWTLARWNEKKALFWGDRSGHRDIRSGILYSPTEDFPGEGAWQAKKCKNCCTFTQFFEICPICSPIAGIRQNCGAVKR